MSRRQRGALSKKYYPRFDSYLIEKILIICGIVLFICSLLFNYVFGSRDLADVLGYKVVGEYYITRRDGSCFE